VKETRSQRLRSQSRGCCLSTACPNKWQRGIGRTPRAYPRRERNTLSTPGTARSLSRICRLDWPRFPVAAEFGTALRVSGRAGCQPPSQHMIGRSSPPQVDPAQVPRKLCKRQSRSRQQRQRQRKFRVTTESPASPSGAPEMCAAEPCSAFRSSSREQPATPARQPNRTPPNQRHSDREAENRNIDPHHRPAVCLASGRIAMASS